MRVDGKRGQKVRVLAHFLFELKSRAEAAKKIKHPKP